VPLNYRHHNPEEQLKGEVATDSPRWPKAMIDHSYKCLYYLFGDAQGSIPLYHATLMSDGLYCITHNRSSDLGAKRVFYLRCFEHVDENKNKYYAAEGMDTHAKSVVYLPLPCEIAKEIAQHGSLGSLLRYPIPSVLKMAPKLNGFNTARRISTNNNVCMPVIMPTVDFLTGNLLATNTCNLFTDNGMCGAPYMDEKGKVIGLHIGGDKVKKQNFCVTPNLAPPS